MDNLEFSSLIYKIIQTKFPELENILEIIVEPIANNDQTHGTGIKKDDQLICLIEKFPSIYEYTINTPQNGKIIFFQNTIEKIYPTQNEIEDAITNEIYGYLN
ncbi:MAG: hypothetical protein CL758_01380 [Chloroflexi bacterium]|nr:hypothetical protein [Chloroflexota bacterium]|tara:strand:- start:27685 stop:27993 length:309 start_codon:yes stop_codon:yes gene_type:complete